MRLPTPDWPTAQAFQAFGVMPARKRAVERQRSRRASRWKLRRQQRLTPRSDGPSCTTTFDHAAAEQEFQRAIEINCRYAHAHQWYGQCIAYMGRFEEALLETTQALQLEPLSLIIHTSHAAVYWSARKWDRAIEYCHKILELDPDFLPTCCLLAHVYQGKGMYDEAVRERRRAVKLACGAPFFVAELGGSCAAAGRTNEARHVLQQLHELANQQYVSAHSFALIYAGLRETEEAFDWLEKAYRERSAALALSKTDPRLDFLRSDPRFQDLLDRMKRARR